MSQHLRGGAVAPPFFDVMLSLAMHRANQSLTVEVVARRAGLLRGFFLVRLAALACVTGIEVGSASVTSACDSASTAAIGVAAFSSG